MARYFLHFRTPQGDIPNSKGIELVHLGRLRDSVTKVANDLVRDNPAAGDRTFEVRDENGRKVLTDKLGRFATTTKPTP